MRSAPFLVPALTLLAVACGSTAPEPAAPAAPAAPGRSTAVTDARAPKPDARATAIAALKADDLDAAKDALDSLLAARSLARATAALDAGDPATALLSIDDLLEAGHPDAVRLKAEGSLALAEETIAAGGNGLLIQGALEDARTYFERLEPATVDAHLGAARAAWLLNDPGRAADHALAAVAQLEDAGAEDDARLAAALRQSAEASFGAYRAAKTNDDEGDDAVLRARFDETETALSALLASAPDDPWVWQTLADLYEWEGMAADARAIAERGLGRLPEVEGLWSRLARIARASEGRAGAADALDAASARAPEVALGHCYRGWERFEHALDAMHAGEDTSADFRAAEAAFVRTAELDEARAEAARGYRVTCRAGLGWCAYHRGDWDAAIEAFRSMDAVFPGGSAWEIEGRLGSGMLGLEFVGAKLNEEERWLEAGRVFRDLFERSGEGDGREGRFANNAAFFLRDAAVEAEFLAQRLCALAAGEEAAESSRERLLEAAGLPTGADANALRKAANERLERARAWMKESGALYRAAARLMPDDVRVVNDAALVHVYYLYTELPWAEEQLLRVAELGERQLADESLTDEDARWELENAWGDVYQNLGVLWATLKDAPAESLPFFERAVEIGPEPRPMVTNQWIPFVKGELEPDAGFAPLANATWGSPCEN